MIFRKLISRLADGQVHSGQDLADAVGVSRTAVWKQLAKLEELGVALESVRGVGYRIPGGVDLLDDQVIREALSADTAPLIGELHLLESVDSTNAEVLRRLPQRTGEGMVICSAEQQLAGRGRRGRTWVSPFARNLYLSIGCEFVSGAGALEGLSLATGVAVIRALQRFGIDAVQLKWPNDLLADGKKLAGILIEMQGDADGIFRVVVGVGVNVAMPASANDQIEQAWTDLHSLSAGQPPARSDLLATLLNEILPLLHQYEDQGFAHWHEHWSALDAFRDRQVVLANGEQRIAGVARGVDERGALRLETALGIQLIHGGELSLRPAD
jgi:BirA family biotin operon repressor/biotin-[acetyl-CoA-carboxylase] ligase